MSAEASRPLTTDEIDRIVDRVCQEVCSDISDLHGADDDLAPGCTCPELDTQHARAAFAAVADAAAKRERAAVVAWLRAEAEKCRGLTHHALKEAARLIEARDHATPPQPAEEQR